MTRSNIIAFPVAAKTSQRVDPANDRAAVFNLDERRAQQTKAPAKDNTKASTKDKAWRPLPLGDVWEAINAGRIQMHYQPQYDLASGEIMAAEVNHPGFVGGSNS